MADQQRIAAPYGDIVLVQTPTLDKAADRLYVEQRQRRLTQDRENQMLDQNIQKELGKVRSVDTPEVINSYNQYKQIKKTLLFDKSLQKDPYAYNKLQQDANSALQNVYRTINGSAEVKDMTKNMTEDRFKNPDNYSDDYGERASTLMNTPLSQLKNHPQYGDMTNWDNYRYQGSNTDFGKLLQTATGQPKQVYSESKILDGGLQTQITPYMYGNTPGQVYEQLVNNFATHRTGRDAAYQWDQVSPDQIKATIQKFNEIPAQKWQKMGLDKAPDLTTLTDNKPDNYAKYLAMNQAINSEPKAGVPIYRHNLKEIKDLEWGRQKTMEAIKFGHQKELKKKDQEAADGWIENFWNNRIGDAKSGQPTTLPDPSNPLQVKVAYEIKPDAVMMKGLARNGKEPDRVYVTNDNKIWPLYFLKYDDIDEKTGKKLGSKSVYTDENGNPQFDKDLSKQMDLDQAYLSLGYRGQTKKQLQGTMEGAYNGSSSNKKYTLDGKSYSHKQLNDMGYDDSEIDQAIKAGIIK